jgi:hypothetical protein
MAVVRGIFSGTGRSAQVFNTNREGPLPKPPPYIEKYSQAPTKQGHETKDDEVAVGRLKFGHICEVHAVNTGNKGKWHKNGRNYRQDSKTVVGAMLQRQIVVLG